MIFRLNMKPDLQVLLRAMPPNRKRKIKEALKAMAQHALCGKALQDDLSGLYSYRIGGWRIIYAIDAAKKILHIIAMGPRSVIYQDLSRDLAKAKVRPKA
jgi:mRNA-degrading endonuclease RelE of RelBE toxin-antitoxin system